MNAEEEVATAREAARISAVLDSEFENMVVEAIIKILDPSNPWTLAKSKLIYALAGATAAGLQGGNMLLLLEVENVCRKHLARAKNNFGSNMY
jgi:hypothetical protein